MPFFIIIPGGQLARVAKICIIAVRKRKDNSKFWKQNPKDYADDISPTSNAEPPSDSVLDYRRDTLELKGHVNHGMDMNEDNLSDTHARVAHLNGVNLHLEVAHHDDSDSSYSSCSNNDDTHDKSSTRRRRKKKKYLKKSKVTKNTDTKARKRNSDGAPSAHGSDASINADKNMHGITIQIDCEESTDSNDKTLESYVNESQRDSHLYDDVSLQHDNNGHSNYNGLPTSHGDHQITEYDSISQCSDHESQRQRPSTGSRGIMLEVPSQGGASHSNNESHTDLATDDGIASIVSSIHTTPSTAPTEIYRSDIEGQSIPTISKSDDRKESNLQILHKALSVSRNGNVSDSSQSQSAPNSPSIMKRKRINRRPSSVSINLACLDSFQSQSNDAPSFNRRRIPRRRERRNGTVKFGAALGSFSSVSENDIAVFSIPLWLALSLLFIYLLIGAIVYSFFENWKFVDSFYYAFISLSTIGFGDLYFVPETFEAALIFNFIYCFIGLSFVSMVWGLSSREFTLLARKIARKLGYYKSRRWRRTVKGWTDKMRQRSIKRWSSRRRNAMKVPAEGEGDTQKYDSDHSDHRKRDSDHRKHDRANHSNQDSNLSSSDSSSDEAEP